MKKSYGVLKRHHRIRFAPLLFVCALGVASAETSYPLPDWLDKPDPVASPHAQQGGMLRFTAFQSPKSLNYYIDSNTYTRQLFGMMYESLLWIDTETTDFVPGLACRWTVSEDKRTFTFTIDPAAQWSDGKPVCAADVKWTFDQVMDPLNGTGATKVSLSVFDSPEIVDARTVRFHAKEAHWRNLLAVGLFEIMPKHAFEGQDFNRLDFDKVVVSGPYILREVKEQIEVRLQRRWNWWATNKPSMRNKMNFEWVVFRYFSDDENGFEAFKKRLVDVYPVYTARIWANEMRGDKFEKNWIVRQRIRNHEPIGFQGFAMNLRRPPFDDVRVRQAMAHLIDRETINRTMTFNVYFLQRSYYEDLYDEAHPCQNPFFAFDVPRAKALLKEAGYVTNSKTGILEKNGKPFTFKFLTRDGSTEKFLVQINTVFKEIGIDLQIERKDWAAWMRDMDAFNFDMTWASWSSLIFRDPEDMWHSKEADRLAGNNITGFKDPRVDALVERQKNCYTIAERNQICREIDAIITEQVPYVLLWNINVTRLAYWDMFGMPKTVLGKYGDERSLIGYWWYDPESAKELETAMKRGEILPARPLTVDYDAVMKRK